MTNIEFISSSPYVLIIGIATLIFLIISKVQTIEIANVRQVSAFLAGHISCTLIAKHVKFC